MDIQQLNADSLAKFAAYITGYKGLMRSQYQQRLAYELSRQQWDGCFQRNVLFVLQKTYDEALKHLIELNFDSRRSQIDRGFSALTRQVLAEFDGFVDEFLLFVVEKHRSSCALSNFPDEHKPDKHYVNTVKREIALLWQDFALNANAHLLDCRLEIAGNADLESQ